MTAHFTDLRHLVYRLGDHPGTAFGPVPSPYLPLTFDEPTTRALVDALATRTRRVQSSADLTEVAHQIAVRNVHLALVAVLEAVVREGGLAAVPEVAAELHAVMASGARFVAAVAEDESVLVNVRGLAARLVAAHDPAGERTGRLTRSPSVLVRLGTVVGLADAQAWSAVRRLLDDPSSAVAAEARFLLDDADEG